MRRLFILLLVLSVCSMATAVPVYWQGGWGGGEETRWLQNGNWSDTWPAGGAAISPWNQTAFIVSNPSTTSFPVIVGTDDIWVRNLQMGGWPGGSTASLDILAGGKLTGWWDGVLLTNSDATINSAGIVDLFGGGSGNQVTKLGNSGGAAAFTHTINITGGSWKTSQLIFDDSGLGTNLAQTAIGHVQLDAGLLEILGSITNLESDQQSLDITNGIIEMLGNQGAWVVANTGVGGHLTGYGDVANIRYEEAGGITTVWAVPEPATMGLLAIGGLLLRKRK